MGRLRVIGLLILIVLFVIVGALVYVLLGPPGAQRGLLPPQTPVPGTVGPGCGVTKTASGYTFSWLHVSGGVILDDKNCIVNLHGFNWAQLEFGNAIGGSAKTRISEAGVAWYTQTFHTNVWRFPVNATWWNDNVYVPLAHMQYRAWMQQVIKWAEDNGDYIILTKGPQFHFPPCGGSVKFCPPQNAGNGRFGPTSPQEQTTGQFIDPGVTMWTSIAQLYANDPAVLYDSWNEMHDIDAQTWHNNTDALIAAIRAQNPRSLIFLGGPNFKGDINPLVKGVVPDFAHPNLVYDFHVYNGYKGQFAGKNCNEPMSYVWQNWPAHADEQVDFAQQHGKAVSFSEWGGCNDFDEYHQAITGYARDHHISLVYYDQANVADFSDGIYTLNTNGQAVQAAYATL